MDSKQPKSPGQRVAGGLSSVASAFGYTSPEKFSDGGEVRTCEHCGGEVAEDGYALGEPPEPEEERAKAQGPTDEREKTQMFADAIRRMKR